jgi:hypothetical protein
VTRRSEDADLTAPDLSHGLPVATPPPSTPPEGYTIQKSMTHHHHETGHGHPARAVSRSLLRMSAAERFVAALAVAGVLWVAVWCVIT